MAQFLRTVVMPLPNVPRAPMPVQGSPLGAWKHRYTPGEVIAGLGELGDSLSGAAAVSEFAAALKSQIIAKAGNNQLANANAVQNLPNLINYAANIYDLGTGGNLNPSDQAAWNSWAAQASNADSDANVSWMFARFVSMNKAGLMAAAANWNPNDAGSQAVFTLMDTSQSGTTWYGGTTVQSKLANSQWASLFTYAWAAIYKGVANGVLPFTYLNVVVRGFVQPPVNRRLPMFTCPPGSLPFNDPKAVAFRTALKQLGWSDVIQRWQSMTQQGWAAAQAQQEAMDDMYSSAITALSFVSGQRIWDEIQEQLETYWKHRDAARESFAKFDSMARGDTANLVPNDDIVAMKALKVEYNTADNMAFETLDKVGLWVGGTAGGMGATIIVQGVVAVTVLGVIAYIVSLMTGTSRAAVAQTTKTADTVLRSVALLQDSCGRAYAASAKTPADEKAYQACIANANALANKIPPPPEGVSDPLGFKGMALAAAVLVGGIVMLKVMGGSKQPKSFKVVADG